MKRKYNKFDMVNAFLLGAAVGASLYFLLMLIELR